MTIVASTAPVGECAKQEWTPDGLVTAGPAASCSGISMSASNCQLTAGGATWGSSVSGCLLWQPPVPFNCGGVGRGVVMPMGCSVGVAGGPGGSSVGCSVGTTVLGVSLGRVVGASDPPRTKNQTSRQTTTAPTTIPEAMKPRSCQKRGSSPSASSAPGPESLVNRPTKNQPPGTWSSGAGVTSGGPREGAQRRARAAGGPPRRGGGRPPPPPAGGGGGRPKGGPGEKGPPGLKMEK